MQGILALFIRALREQVRGASFAWMRGGMATVVLITLFFYMQWSSFAGGAVGMEFFQPFAIYNAIMICIAALSYFASAITEEKEEQTLGLLRMTDLSVLAILFGKSTSRMLGGLVLLIVQFPFALLAVTLGGMAWEQILIVYALLCAFLFFAANVGLFASVLAKSGGYAGLLTAIFGGVYLGGGELLDELYHWLEYDVAFPWAASVSEASIVVSAHCGPQAFFEAISIGWVGAPWKETVVTFLVAGGVFFALAWASFGRFARDESVAGPRQKKGGRLAWLKGRAGRAWQDGIAWKDFHFIHGGWRIFWLKAALYAGSAVWLWIDEFSDRTWPYRMNQFMGQILGLSILFGLGELAAMSSRAYRLEQRLQTLGSIYLLPQDLKKLARSKRLALLLAMVPVLCFFTVSFLWLLPEMLEGMGHGGEAFLGVMYVIWITPLEVIFHYRLVVWFSLRLRWGGLPAAFVVSFFAHLVTLGILIGGAQSAAGIPFILILFVVNVVLKTRITRRIEAGAAEG